MTIIAKIVYECLVANAPLCLLLPKTPCEQAPR